MRPCPLFVVVTFLTFRLLQYISSPTVLSYILGRVPITLLAIPILCLCTPCYTHLNSSIFTLPYSHISPIFYTSILPFSSHILRFHDTRKYSHILCFHTPILLPYSTLPWYTKVLPYSTFPRSQITCTPIFYTSTLRYYSHILRFHNTPHYSHILRFHTPLLLP